MNDPDKKNISLPISELLKDKRFSITDLCNKADAIRKTNQKLKKYLDPSLSNHFELANIKTDSVIILVNSSALATRLRYTIPVLLNILNKELNLTSVKTVRIKVKKMIPDISDPKTPKKPMSLSKDSAQSLLDAANHFTDQGLRERLLKLSKNYRE